MFEKISAVSWFSSLMLWSKLVKMCCYFFRFLRASSVSSLTPSAVIVSLEDSEEDSEEDLKSHQLPVQLAASLSSDYVIVNSEAAQDLTCPSLSVSSADSELLIGISVSLSALSRSIIPLSSSSMLKVATASLDKFCQLLQDRRLYTTSTISNYNSTALCVLQYFCSDYLV